MCIADSVLFSQKTVREGGMESFKDRLSKYTGLWGKSFRKEVENYGPFQTGKVYKWTFPKRGVFNCTS